LEKLELEAKSNHELFSINFLLFKEKIIFKSHLINSNHRFPRKNKVDTYGAQVFAPDQSAAVLAAKMCTFSHEHSMDIISLWLRPIEIRVQ
jgi:hypothetical protein